MGNVMESKLKHLQKKVNAGGIDSYIVEEDDCDSEDSFEAAQTGGSIMDKSLVNDPSKLIDLELIKLLKYCGELEVKRQDDDYQEEIMMKSFELGKKTAPKLLIFDMDETLIAAKFEGKVPKDFEETFSFPFMESHIYVRTRPYLVDALEKLSLLYEIIVFTAGVKDYADHILDYIDPNGTIFKKRLYRTDCIQVD